MRWRFCGKGPFEFKDKCMSRALDGTRALRYVEGRGSNFERIFKNSVHLFLRNKIVGRGFERGLDF